MHIGSTISVDFSAIENMLLLLCSEDYEQAKKYMEENASDMTIAQRKKTLIQFLLRNHCLSQISVPELVNERVNQLIDFKYKFVTLREDMSIDEVIKEIVLPAISEVVYDEACEELEAELESRPTPANIEDAIDMVNDVMYESMEFRFYQEDGNIVVFNKVCFP